MSVSWKHVLSQGPVLSALGQTAISLAIPSKGSADFNAPGPLFEATLPPRSPDLVRAYVRNVGGDPKAYRNALPPHLFPQWGFGLAAKTLIGAPYPMAKVVNGGCRYTVNAPLDPSKPLHVSAQLASIDDNGRRVVLEQKIVTGNPGNPEALIAHLFAIVPLPRPKDQPRGPRKPKATVPMDVREVARMSIRRDAGLDFAKLTGDFNPIHWIPAYARMSGFKSTILHGFGTMARAIEGLNRNVFAGATPIEHFDCKFTRPLVMPAKVGLYIRRTGEHLECFVGEAPGGASYMQATCKTG